MSTAAVALHKNRYSRLNDLSTTTHTTRIYIGAAFKASTVKKKPSKRALSKPRSSIKSSLWSDYYKTIKVAPEMVALGKLLGQGAHSDVFLGNFAGEEVAVKVFRNASEQVSFNYRLLCACEHDADCVLAALRSAIALECDSHRGTMWQSALKEISLMYELRHPCIVNIISWYVKPGSITQFAVVMEKCDGGELEKFYTAADYKVAKGMQVVLDASYGLAYMHSFSTPIVHRDIKSANILVTGEARGKLADCGESRRVDYNSTMTRKGSPLWAGEFKWRQKRVCQATPHP